MPIGKGLPEKGGEIMTILNFITLFGGLAFFLYGMTVMSGGLEKMSGGKLEKTLKKMTSNPFKSLLLGAGITIAIQSSSAMTVMLVGLVNSGIMQLEQTVGVIMGSNIGTTLTAWLTSAAGIESDSILISLLKPENFAPIFALVGISLIMLSKKTRRKDIGGILVGFAVLMYGMKLMSSSMEPLSSDPSFTSILTAFKNPLFGVLIGTVVTGVIQSSAASVGILQALALTGNITFSMAIPIIMGQNIGTCVTSLISSIGVNKNAKRVAAVHISFNIIGTAICLSVYCLLDAFSLIPFADTAISTFGIAICHTVFNVVTTIMLLPFSKMLVKLARFVVRDKDGDKQGEKYAFIDQRLLNTPSVALSECQGKTVEMAHIAKDTINTGLEIIEIYDEEKANRIIENENMLDMYEDKLGSYLVKLSQSDLSDADGQKISKLLHTIGDFERLGDHAVNLLKTAEEIHEKHMTFSKQAQNELRVLTNALHEILDITISAFESDNTVLAKQVEPLEQVIDELIAATKYNHINRLKNGSCTIEIGFVLNDMLTNYERISDHCSNIAVAIIEVEQNAFDTHKYLTKVKTGNDEDFVKAFNMYNEKYIIKNS